jgi:hypothetical protein
MDYPELDDEFHWRTEHFCKDVQIARESKWDLGFGKDKNFFFNQYHQESDSHPLGKPVLVQGDLIFRRIGDGTPGPSVVVKSIVNDDRIQVNLKWNAGEQNLWVGVPQSLPWDEAATGPCVSIVATVWVPDDGKFLDIEAKTVHLGIKLLDNLSLLVSQKTTLSSVAGSIVAASTGVDSRDKELLAVGPRGSFRFDSRRIHVKTISSNIIGAWPLYDSLLLETTSGDIKTYITPKEAKKDSVKPAALVIKSLSGTIEFHEPVHEATNALLMSQYNQDGSVRPAEVIIPPRDYRVDIHSTSGNIQGALAFTSLCKVHSTSANINLDLLPVLDSDNLGSVSLDSSVTSGTTAINVMEPLWFGSERGGLYLPPLPSIPSFPTPPTPPMPPTPPTPPRAPGSANDDPEYTPIGSGDPYDILPPRNAHPPLVHASAALAAAMAQAKQIKAQVLAAQAKAQAEKQKQQEQVPPRPPQPVVAPETDPQAQTEQTHKVNLAANRALKMGSRHGSTSSSVRLRYPASWEGDIKATTVTGGIRVHGKDVQIVKQDNGWANKEVLARKGQEGKGGYMTVKTTSGDIEVLVGED